RWSETVVAKRLFVRRSELQQLYCSRCFEHRTVLAVVTGEKGPSVSLPPPVLRPLCFFLVSPQVEMAEETGVWAPTESGKRHSCGPISAQKSGRFPLLKWLLQKLAMARLMNLTARLKIPKRPPQVMPPPLSKARLLRWRLSPPICPLRGRQPHCTKGEDGRGWGEQYGKTMR
uniref:Uncharacterized protein n=1 Tax=Echinococcus canadensis TaxID=519352 RepID=A0A915EZA2_9CEST